MNSQRGITIVELIVIISIAVALAAIAIPKFIETAIKDKMWDGMTTLMTYESAQLAYLAQTGRIGPVDSLVFKAGSSKFFYFAPDSAGFFRATAKTKIGKFKEKMWLRTAIDTTGGMPRIRRSCSAGDSGIVKRYISHFFN